MVVCLESGLRFRSSDSVVGTERCEIKTCAPLKSVIVPPAGMDSRSPDTLATIAPLGRLETIRVGSLVSELCATIKWTPTKNPSVSKSIKDDRKYDGNVEFPLAGCIAWVLAIVLV